MLRLAAIESKSGARFLLRFSDGAWGVFDFSHYVEANMEMTAPLGEPAFFAKHFIEAGALAWPNGFDLSAGSLCRKLHDAGELHRNVAAA